MRPWLLTSLLLCAGALGAEPLHPMLRAVPPLPGPVGRVVNVSTADQLRAAVSGAKDGDTIAIADGTYMIVPFLWLKDKKNVTIRGASGDPAKVILRGKGWDQGGDHDNEDIILDRHQRKHHARLHPALGAEVHAYAVKINAESSPRNINIYNCCFRNFGIRGIKGTKGSAGHEDFGGTVRYCFFENTKIPPPTWQFDGDYVSSIDMMFLNGWTFSDNVFKDIKGCHGVARGAVFVWVQSHDVTVERNVFINCDRGVCFGNPSTGTNEWNVHNCICRNNVFSSTNNDAMVEMSNVDGAKIYNNTILKTDPQTRGVRVCANTDCKNIEIVNNIIHGGMELSGAKESSNYTGPTDGYFKDPAHADFRLTAAAVGVINKGAVLKEIKEDFDALPRDAQPDIGACEFKSGSPSSGAAATADSGKSGAEKGTPVADNASARRDAIIQLLQNSKDATGFKLRMKVLGRDEDVRFKGADAENLKVDLEGNLLPVRWRDVSDADLIQIAVAAGPESPDLLFNAGALAAAPQE